MRLPVAPAALPGSDLTFDRLGVAMNAQGRLLVDGRALDEEAASAWWADQAKTRRAGLETLGDPTAGSRRFADRRDPPGRSGSLVRGSPAGPGRGPGQGLRALQPGRFEEAWAMSTGAGLGMGLSLSTAESAPAMAVADMAAPRSTALSAGTARGGLIPGRTDARHGVSTPGLLHPDVQSPFGRDPPGPRPTRDAGGPARRVPWRSSSHARANVDTDLENDLLVRAEADDLGDLKALRLGEAPLPDLATLGKRLRRYTELLEGRPLRVRLVADDGLRYEPAARIIATCSAAGVAAIRLTQPGPRLRCPAVGAKPQGSARTGPGSGGPDEPSGFAAMRPFSWRPSWSWDVAPGLSPTMPNPHTSSAWPTWPAIARP